MVRRVIAIGASLNGVAAFTELARNLPRNLPAAVLIVQHVASHSPGFLPHMLAKAGKMPVLHPSDGEEIAEGHIYVTPGRIAAGDFRLDDRWQLERMSKPSGMNCPDCRSAIYEMNDRRVLRYRCRAGHAFSAESLASGQSEARYSLLSALFGALMEESTLLGRLAEADGGGASGTVAHRGEAQRLQTQTEQVCEWLRPMAGFVEPEPLAHDRQENVP